MNIIHCAALHWQKISGPAESVPGLVAAQNACPGVRTALVTTLADPGQTPQTPFPVYSFRRILDGTTGFGLPAPLDRPDLIVFHSTYIPAHSRIAARARRLGVPYVICPRGGMTDDAQSHRRWKKWLGNLAFFDRMVAGAAAIHCLTAGEAEQIRRWPAPRFVVGNGIALPPLDALATPGRRPQRRLLFVGRLAVEHKGLDLLLDACAILRPLLAERNPRIELCGPDHRGGAVWLARRIERDGLGEWVSVRGPVRGDAKREALRAADVFLHTSRWEGHPMAVLEALAYGVPCLLTPATNLAEEVAADNAGWAVAPTPEGIAAGLEAAITEDLTLLRAMAAAARQTAEQRYDWGRIARQTLNAYGTLLQRSAAA